MWLFVAVCQWLVTFSSLVMVIIAYSVVRTDYSQCMIGFSGHPGFKIKILDAVALGTFTYQPIILTKQMIMWCVPDRE